MITGKHKHFATCDVVFINSVDNGHAPENTGRVEKKTRGKMLFAKSVRQHGCSVHVH